MESVNLQIQLPFKLDSYASIKRLLDAIKVLFPEQTSDGQMYPYSITSNYQFSLNEGVLSRTYYGTKDLLNAIYRKSQVSLASMSIHNYEQRVILGKLDVSTIILLGYDINRLENLEIRIKELLGTCQGDGNQGKEEEFPNENQMSIGSGKLEEITFSSRLFDAEFVDILNNRISELQKAIKNEMPLSAILLIGSTLEGALFMVAMKYPRKFNTAVSAPKNKEGKVFPFGAWTLNNLIEVAFELDILKRDVKDFSKVVRDFRNFIHPNEQVKQDFSPTMDTVEIASRVLKAALGQINVFVENNPIPT